MRGSVIGASLGKPEFFDADMYMFHVTGFRPNAVS